jgi:hypothetical protein
MRRLFSTVLGLVLSTVCLAGPAAADDASVAGGIEWVSDAKARNRPPSPRRPLAEEGHVAYTGIRAAFGGGESLLRFVAADSVLGDGLLQRNSHGASVQLRYSFDENRSAALTLERLDNGYLGRHAWLDSVSHTARGVLSQRLGSALAAELRLQAELSSEVNRRGVPGLSGIVATGLAEIAFYPAPDWEISFGLSSESTRLRGASEAGDGPGTDHVGAVVLTAEHAFAPTTRLRCEAETGMMWPAGQRSDRMQHQFGCALHVEL